MKNLIITILLFITFIVGYSSAIENTNKEPWNACSICLDIVDQIEIILNQNNSISSNIVIKELTNNCTNSYENTKWEKICLHMVNSDTINIIKYINQHSNKYFICEQLLHECQIPDSSDDSYTGAFTTSPMTSDIEVSPSSSDDYYNGGTGFRISLQ